MSVEIIKKETKVVFQRQNKIVHASMYGDLMTDQLLARIWRKGDSLFYDFLATNKEIKENLYDLVNESVKNHFRRMNYYPREFKLLNFEKPEGDLLKIVENVFCKGEEFSLLVEYEFHSLEESLFDCKDCG